MQSVLTGARSERILVTYRCIVKLAMPAKQSAESNVFGLSAHHDNTAQVSCKGCLSLHVARWPHGNGPQALAVHLKCAVFVQLETMKMDPSFLSRNVNEGFSGGEKKRNEILQLAVLEPDVAILDEIDSGLDVDALRDVANAVNGLRSEQNSLLMITHYKRLLEYIRPDVVHVMEDGAIIKTGDMDIVDQLELGGYATVT